MNDEIEMWAFRARVATTGAALRRRPELLAALLMVFALALFVYWAIWADRSPAWTGFGAYDEVTQGGTSEDALGLAGVAVISTLLALGASVRGKTNAGQGRGDRGDCLRPEVSEPEQQGDGRRACAAGTDRHHWGERE